MEYRNAVVRDPQWGAARMKLAKAFEKVGQVRKAGPEFIRAADLMPADDEAQLQAAEYLRLAGRFEEARERAKTVLARDPRCVRAQLLVAMASGSLGDLDGAVSDVRKAIAMDPQHAGAHVRARPPRNGARQAAARPRKRIER